MAKRLKQKLSRVLPSLQLCRTDKSEVNSSAFPRNRVPSTCRLSPINPKSFDISFPSFTAPAPPSTPDRSFTRSCHVPRSKLSGRESSAEYTSKKDGRHHMVSKSNQRTTATAAAAKKGREDTEALLLSSNSGSFSDEDSPTEFSSRRSSSVETTETTTLASSSSSSSVLRQLRLREPAGKVRESVAVVKRSEDPLEDFRRSMWEMVVEKEMFAATDLEQLLICFLSLNSPKYHPVIVEAFSGIWQLLFSDHRVSPPRSRRASKF